MAERVITLNVGNASIPIYAKDWPAVKKTVEETLEAHGQEAACYGCGVKERITAKTYTVAEKSRLAEGTGV